MHGRTYGVININTHMTIWGELKTPGTKMLEMNVAREWEGGREGRKKGPEVSAITRKFMVC